MMNECICHANHCCCCHIQVPSVDPTASIPASTSTLGSLVIPAPNDYFGAIQSCRRLGGSMIQWSLNGQQVRATGRYIEDVGEDKCA